MHVAGGEVEPPWRLRVGLDIVARQQLRIGETLGEIKQYRGDLGKRAPVDDKRGDLAFRIERQVARRAHVVILERHRPPVESNADLVQRNVHCHRT